MSIQNLVGQQIEIMHLNTSEKKSLGKVEREGTIAQVLDAWAYGQDAMVLAKFDDGRMIVLSVRCVKLLEPKPPADENEEVLPASGMKTVTPEEYAQTLSQISADEKSLFWSGPVDLIDDAKMKGLWTKGLAELEADNTIFSGPSLADAAFDFPPDYSKIPIAHITMGPGLSAPQYQACPEDVVSPISIDLSPLPTLLDPDGNAPVVGVDFAKEDSVSVCVVPATDGWELTPDNLRNARIDMSGHLQVEANKALLSQTGDETGRLVMVGDSSIVTFLGENGDVLLSDEDKRQIMLNNPVEHGWGTLLGIDTTTENFLESPKHDLSEESRQLIMHQLGIPTSLVEIAPDAKTPESEAPSETVEDFLEPLKYEWSEESYQVRRAIEQQLESSPPAVNDEDENVITTRVTVIPHQIDPLLLTDEERSKRAAVVGEALVNCDKDNVADSPQIQDAIEKLLDCYPLHYYQKPGQILPDFIPDNFVIVKGEFPPPPTNDEPQQQPEENSSSAA